MPLFFAGRRGDRHLRVVRYQRILVEAERLGEQATCGGCGAYARFRLISASEVRCRKCQHVWRLIDGWLACRLSYLFAQACLFFKRHGRALEALEALLKEDPGPCTRLEHRRVPVRRERPL